MKIFNRLAHFIAGSTPLQVQRAIVASRDVIVPDISFWQDDNATPQKVDFTAMKAAGAAGVNIRSGQGTWHDEDGRDYMTASRGIFPRGLYWFYDSRYSPTVQAERLYAFVQSIGGLPEMEVWADYEDSYNGAYTGWKYFSAFMLECERLIPGIRLGIYTGYYYWLDHSPNPITQPAQLAWFGKYPLWLAWYTNDPSIVKVPRPWSTALFWQFTDKGDGRKYGVESLNIDLNYFVPGAAEFAARYGLATTPPPPPVEPPPAPVTGWYMPIPVPGNGIPAITQTSHVRDMSKRAAIMLDAGWQDWIRRLQPSADVYGWYIKPDACPTKGINANGKLIHNRIVYAGNPVKITEIVDGWGLVDGWLPAGVPVLSDHNRYNRPDIVARLWQVESNGKLNVPSRLASLARLPIFAGWVEMSRVTRIVFPRIVTVKSALNIRATPDKSQAPIGGLSAGAQVRIADITPGQGGWWGKLADRAGYICLRWSDASNPRGTNYTDWLI